ncbi:caprin-2 isoform X12 [Ochotona curzoniae]|uniref:caprin-2 isoform X12 n=1 Tax=Ochotona curzoniae TaxID=130825 RepID=UPI001B34C736|nr:caprin-2 isoform X12 [Ochotona curzoniae]
MKAAKPQVNHSPHGEGPRAMSPLQAALTSAASQAYETYIDNGLICLKHKIRNIEKKKLKLEDYKDRLRNGEHLNPDQLEAVEKYEEVLHNLEFAKELQKTFSGLSQDLLKAQKKAQRREQLMKLEAEKKKLRTILQVQYVLQNLAQEHVQKDFQGGLNGAVYLPSKELDYLIKFSKLTCPERNESLSVEDQMEQSSLYFWDLLEGSEKAVVGTTYKHMKDLLSKLLNSGYFESIPVPKNAKEKKVSLEEELLIQSEKKKQLLKTEPVAESDALLELAQPEIQPQEFLNRHYMTEVDYSSKPEEQPWEADYARKPNLPKCWNVLAEPDGQEQQQEPFKSWESAAKPPEAAKPAVCLEPRKPEAPKPRSTLQEDPKKQCVSKAKPAPSQRKQEVPKAKASCTAGEQREQGPSKPWPGQQQKEQDPKKPSPPKSWTPPVHSEQGLTKSWTPSLGEDQESKQLGSPKTWEDGVRGQKHSSTPHSQISAKSWGAAAASLMPSDPLLPRKFNAEPKDVPSPVHQPIGSSSALPKDPVLRKEKLQDLMTQIQGTCNFMQESILEFEKPSSAIPSSQPPSPAPESPGASMEQKLSSRSESLQEPSQVFNANAPLPPRKEQEMKDPPYSPGYNQSFTTASTQTPPQCQLPAIHVEQTVLSPETAANHHPDGTIQVSNGSLAFYPAQTGVFPRAAQPFVGSRGSVRGCARGGRLLTNSYRSPGGYKGFDTYRGLPSISNGNYSQLHFQGRDYPGSPYSQRENFQQCYKRGGASGGPRANSRANCLSMRNSLLLIKQQGGVILLR